MATTSAANAVSRKAKNAAKGAVRNINSNNRVDKDSLGSSLLNKLGGAFNRVDEMAGGGLSKARDNVKNSRLAQTMGRDSAEIGSMRQTRKMQIGNDERDAVADLLTKRANSAQEVGESALADQLNAQAKSAANGVVDYKNSIGDNIKQYYDHGTKGGARKAVTAGAVGLGVAGASIGHRYSSGGSLTRKADGERDIAGVPFV